MAKILAPIVLIILAAGCTAPVPEGFELTNADQAVKALFAEHNAQTAAMPWVHGVHLDPSCTVKTPRGPGIRFRDPADGVCVSGLKVGSDIWVVWTDGLTFSNSALAHEIVHWLDDDQNHRAVELWEARSGSTSKEVRGQQALRALGPNDTMKLF